VFLGENTDGLEPTSAGIFCPVCAAEEFGCQPEQADGHT
jgi:hypothetical protein